MSHTHPTVRSALQWAQAQLSTTSPTAQLDAAVLLAHGLHISRAALYAAGQQQLSAHEWSAFQAQIAQRRSGVPVAYITGSREFFGLELHVTPAVLVPRPDTEILVEAALRWIGAQQQPLTIADVGTGSGCIAVALAANAAHVHVYALDLSPAALAVARSNVQQHSLSTHVTLLESNVLQALPAPVNLIVSNPPYTLLDEIDSNVRAHEPQLALDGGPDGLDCYRTWMPAMAQALVASGPRAVMLEIGAWQGSAVADLAASIWPTASITIWPDLAGRDRVVDIQLS